MMKNIQQFFKPVLFTLILCILVFVFIEGLLSTIIVLRDVFKPVSLVSEAAYTKYDELLGWVNTPNLEIKDKYGSGVYLKTNSQGFRNDHDFGVKVPKEKIRVICSGDSFTFGFGVSNEQTWCQQLVSLDRRLETLNLGQGGYGIDQAYLWYMRDGKKFEHNIHIFAFITDDFYRMYTEYYGGKPVLKLVNGKLEAHNVPVSKYHYLFPKLSEQVERFKQLRFYEFFKRIGKKMSLIRHERTLASRSNIQEVTLKIFETLHYVNKKKGSTLVLVSLPEYEECFSDSESLRKWRMWLSTEMAKRGILFIDLIDEFKGLTATELTSLYNKKDWHFSEKGNEFVARVLYKKIVSYGLVK